MVNEIENLFMYLQVFDLSWEISVHSFGAFFSYAFGLFLIVSEAVMFVANVCVLSHLVVSDSLQHNGLYPARLLCPQDSPGKNTRVGSISFSRGSSWPRGQTCNSCISCIGRWILYHCTTWEANQFSSVAQLCPTLCDPMNHSTPGLPVHHQLSEFTQTHVHRVSDAIQPSHPLSSPSSPAPNSSQHQSLFQWVNSSHEIQYSVKLYLDHMQLCSTLRKLKSRPPEDQTISNSIVSQNKDEEHMKDANMPSTPQNIKITSGI